MTVPLRDKKLLIVGGSSGIGLRLAADAAAGAKVTLAGRDRRALGELAAGITGTAGTAHVDLGDEDSIRQLAEQAGELDYLACLAAAHANGRVTSLHRDAIARAFDAKVTGPILLAKHRRKFCNTPHSAHIVPSFPGPRTPEPVPGHRRLAPRLHPGQ